MASLSKKVFFGFVWFLVVLVGVHVGCALILGVIFYVSGGADSVARAQQAKGEKRRDAVEAVQSAYEIGRRQGEETGRDFWRNYGLVLNLLPLIIAVGGTLTGVLPGTSSKSKNNTTPYNRGTGRDEVS